MRVLVIGGNRFMGRGLVWRLLCGGHRVTVVNRGNLPDPFGDRIERLRADRSTDAFDRAIGRRTFDAAVDFAGFTADDTARAVRVLSGRVGHYVFISTGQVYLVREGCPQPSREDDYAGPVMAAPPSPADREDWAYGIGKRGAEDVLAAASGLPSTRLRLPMVNGEHDPRRRIEGYVRRILDRGPLIVPRADAIARHVHSGAVIRAIASILEEPPPLGLVYNLAQPEQLTVRALLER
ncbi:MAG TPA: NAD-dependent epimerase/dehydratase family protein, partial [Kofleriaceae bacterium]|nr:NAD-dependent epimerase/dehydratase family protein [Kofleriaceae bacterium]